MAISIRNSLLFLVPSLASAIITSCGPKDANMYDSMKDITSMKGTRISSITLEKVTLDSVKCSGESMSGITPDGSVYYYDSYFCWMYRFSPDGRLESRSMGYGRGPKESILRKSNNTAMSPDGKFAIYGSSYDFEYFSPDGTLKNRFRLIKRDGNHADPEDFMAYSTPVYDPVSRVVNDRMYIGLTSDNPEFCYFFTNSEYLEKSCRIGVVNLESGAVEGMVFKGFPSMYGVDPYRYTSFDNVAFDFDKEGRLYLGFQADQKIYVFDSNLKPLHSFGVEPDGMDRSYEKIERESDIPKWQDNLDKKGYYTWIEYVDETDLCFRSYRKGEAYASDGLQIYSSDGHFLGDCEVPKGLNVKGYIAPYYYSQVFTDEDGKLTLYRFRL